MRALLIAQASAVAGVGANYTVGQVAGAISALRAALGGGGKDVGVEVYGSATVQGGGSIVPAVAPLNPLNGLTFSRTPAQVLAIVTGGGAHGAGLFFPNGLSLGPGAAAWLGL